MWGCNESNEVLAPSGHTFQFNMLRELVLSGPKLCTRAIVELLSKCSLILR